MMFVFVFNRVTVKGEQRRTCEYRMRASVLRSVATCCVVELRVFGVVLCCHVFRCRAEGVCVVLFCHLLCCRAEGECVVLSG